MITGQNIQLGIQTQVQSGKYNAACVLSARRIITAIRFIAFIMLVSIPVCVKAQTEIPDTTVITTKVQFHIDFRANLTDIDRTYHCNGSQLEKVLAVIDSMVQKLQRKVSRITVMGTASPEGPYENNVRLATDRAEALIRILKDRYSFPDSIYAVSAIPEDWEGMRIMVAENDTIPYAGTVLAFLDESGHLSPDIREDRLKRLDEGRPYASMRENVLPYLRRASVAVDYDLEWLNRIQAIKPAEI